MYNHKSSARGILSRRYKSALSYAVGYWNILSGIEVFHRINSFSFEKPDYIRQEIWARLILYNFCEAITTKTIMRQSNRIRKHCYQLNFTRAIHICRFFLSIRKGAPSDVESLISRELLPVRPGRTDPRKVKPQAASKLPLQSSLTTILYTVLQQMKSSVCFVCLYCCLPSIQEELTTISLIVSLLRLFAQCHYLNDIGLFGLQIIWHKNEGKGISE